jgi:hypothetical protein
MRAKPSQCLATKVEVHFPAEKRPGIGGTGRLGEPVELDVAKVPQPWGEGHAQQVEQGKDDVGPPGGVRGMLFWPQLQRVVQDAVEHDSRFPHR